MPIIVQSVLPKSLAAQHGIVPKDRLKSINSHELHDFLDLEYYGAEPVLHLELETADGALRSLTINRIEGQSLSIEPEPYHIRHCQNSCIFCFIDQMPPHLRSTLYAKDDDFLYSFVFGNYITLTNLREEDYRRILEQRINPLYISLHTTDSKLRQAMMHSARQIDIMAAMRRLTNGGISFHLQIVCVPGFNDGGELTRSLDELLSSKLNILSIGVVPVGLTRFRKGLSTLQPFDKSGALNTLQIIREARTTHSTTIVYPADEFFVLAQEAIPGEDYYEDYPQLENGIGMLRLSLQNFRSRKRSLLKEMRKAGTDFLFVTSESAYETICLITEELNARLETQRVRVQSIRNGFFGNLITVSGLLTFADIAAQLQPLPTETIVLPSNIFNHDGETLDGKERNAFKTAFANPVLVIDQFFEDWDYL